MVLRSGHLKNGYQLCQRGGVKKIFNVVESKLFQSILVRSSNSRNAIDPALQDNVLLPKEFTEYIYHVGNASELNSRIRNGFIPGGTSLNRGRQAVFFFTAVNPMEDKLIDTGQIIITQKLQVLKNDISVTMVSWGKRVTSEDKYITIVSTDLVTAVTYLGFEYRSAHDGDRRGFTAKPTAKYVHECLDIVQLQYAKAVMTPLTEQKSLNLHDETTACDQVQHSFFRAVVGICST